MKEHSDIITNEEDILLENITFDELLVNLRKLKDEEKVSDIWFDVYNYYNNKKEWKDKLLEAVNLLEYSGAPEK